MFVRNDIHAEQVLINCLNNNLEVICVNLTLNSLKIRPPYYTADDVQYIESFVTVFPVIDVK